MSRMGIIPAAFAFEIPPAVPVMYIVRSGSTPTCNWIPIASSSRSAGATSSYGPSASSRQDGSKTIALTCCMKLLQARHQQALRHVDLRGVVLQRRGSRERNRGGFDAYGRHQRSPLQKLLDRRLAQRFARDATEHDTRLDDRAITHMERERKRCHGKI